MNVLIIDQECLGLDFALRCAARDHKVRWFMDSKKPIKDGQGFKQVEIVNDWQSSMKWAKDGLIVATGNCKYLHQIDAFRALGYQIFSPTVASANLEILRSVGMDAMRASGIEVPPYHVFSSLAEAEKFARKSDRAWVHKPMGDEDDKSLTYVASDPADLVGWLQRRIAQGTKLKGQVMLQEKIDMLCELGVSGWFGPDGFLPDKWQICVEHKKLMSGDCGPATGEQGTVTQYVDSDKLANETLIPMVGALRAAGHRGDFAVGVGIDKAGKCWPFEFTARLGWPCFYIQCASHFGDPAQWMRDLLDGKDTLKVSSNVAIGVVCAQPNYPYNKSSPELVEGNPIHGLEDVWNDIHPVSVMVGKGPKMEGSEIKDGPIYQTTGEYVLVATGLGKTVEKARKKVYGVVDTVGFPNMMYRDDIGESLKSKLPKLHSFGYAMDMEY